MRAELDHFLNAVAACVVIQPPVAVALVVNAYHLVALVVAVAPSGK